MMHLPKNSFTCLNLRSIKSLGLGTLLLLGPALHAMDAGTDASQLQWNGDIQIQSQKAFQPEHWGNNLDQLWGRLNLKVNYSSDQFASEAMIRAYPDGFGYEALNLSDQVNREITLADTLVPSAQTLSQFQLYRAWVRYTFTYFDFRIGRVGTMGSYSNTWGNYLDQNPGGSFQSRDVVHNAMEITKDQGIYNTSVMLTTNDRFLNRGILRVKETAKLNEQIQLAIGYSGSIFDPVYYGEEEDILSRVAAEAAYLIKPSLKIFLEAAWIQQREGDDLIPVLLGLSVPTMGRLDKLQFEVEYDNNRVDSNGEDKPLIAGIYAEKGLFQRMKFEAALFQSPSGADELQNLTASLRFSSSLR